MGRKGHRMPEQLCPKCGHLLDAASNLDNPRAKPKPEDYTVCIACAAILRFNSMLRLDVPTPEDVAALQRDDPDYFAEMQRVRRAVLMLPPRDSTPQGPRN